MIGIWELLGCVSTPAYLLMELLGSIGPSPWPLSHYHNSQGLVNEGQAWVFLGQDSWAQADCLMASVLWWTWPLLTSREIYDFLLFSTTWKPLRRLKWKIAAAKSLRRLNWKIAAAKILWRFGVGFLISQVILFYHFEDGSQGIGAI